MESPPTVLSTDRPRSAHRTLAEKAFDRLHVAIITGRLRPGDRLPIEELGRELEMSAMPIREALRRLDAAGLVEHVPHRGARVTMLSIDDLAEVFEARLALEPLAIRQAAERFTSEDETVTRRAMTDLHRMTDETADVTAAAHRAFHFALYRAAGSAWLVRLIRPVWETGERYCLEVPESRQLRAREHEHVAIAEACAAHDPAAAAAALYAHLATTANAIAVAMGGEPLYEIDAPSLRRTRSAQAGRLRAR